MYNDEELHYMKYFSSRDNRIEVYDGDKEKIYSNYVKVDVEKSSSEEFSIKVRKVSEARKKDLAKKSAEALEYEYVVDGNDLTLNAFLLSTSKYKYLDERIYVTIYIPENASVHFDKNTANFLYGVYTVDRMRQYKMADHYFLMTDKGLDCTDCEVKKEKKTEEKKEEVAKDSISE